MGIKTVGLLVLGHLVGLLGLCPAPDAKDVELAVLRHQLAVLRRQVARPRYQPSDRLVSAWLASLLPRERWSVFLVTPATLLRWHRELVAHRWTHPHTGEWRGLDPEAVDLVLRLARENPRWGYQWIVGEARRLGVVVSATSVRRVLRSGLPERPAPLAESSLIMIDLQNTYTRGVMQLEGVQPAIDQAAELLDRTHGRDTGLPHA